MRREPLALDLFCCDLAKRNGNADAHPDLIPLVLGALEATDGGWPFEGPEDERV